MRSRSPLPACYQRTRALFVLTNSVYPGAYRQKNRDRKIFGPRIFLPLSFCPKPEAPDTGEPEFSAPPRESMRGAMASNGSPRYCGRGLLYPRATKGLGALFVLTNSVYPGAYRQKNAGRKIFGPRISLPLSFCPKPEAPVTGEPKFSAPPRESMRGAMASIGSPRYCGRGLLYPRATKGLGALFVLTNSVYPEAYRQKNRDRKIFGPRIFLSLSFCPKPEAPDTGEPEFSAPPRESMRGAMASDGSPRVHVAATPSFEGSAAFQQLPPKATVSRIGAETRITSVRRLLLQSL